MVYSLICLRRVFKIFRFTEVPLFFNNLCISLSCVLYITNASIYLAYLVKNYGKQGSEDYNYLQQLQQTIIGIVFMFMFFAFQFDLYKWSVFIASSSTMDRYTLEEKSLVYDKRQSYLKWSLVVS